LSDTMFQNRNYPPKIQQIFRRISHSVGNYNIHYIASDHWKNPLLDLFFRKYSTSSSGSNAIFSFFVFLNVRFRTFDVKICVASYFMQENTVLFLKKWWVESDFKTPNLPLSIRFKGSGCHYNSIYNKTGTKR
jgi:hypothetical protein